MPATILIVDDDDALLRALGRGLRRKDRLILMASGGEQALALLREHDVNVIISDQRMPGLLGSQLLHRLRPDYPGLVRILMTGQPSVDSAVEAVNDEVFRYIPKPCSLDELDTMVDEAVVRSEERRALTAASSEHVRKRQLRDALEAEHPGLLHVPHGAYHVPDSELVPILLAAPMTTDDRALAELSARVQIAGPIGIADAILGVVFAQARCTLSVQPIENSQHRISLSLRDDPRVLAAIPSGIGDAVAARLTVIAGGDPTAVGNHLYRVTAARGDMKMQLLVAFGTSALGLGVEVRRLLTLADLEEVAVSADGKTLGAYHLLEQIGEGGLGVVYRAQRDEDAHPVAIKILRRPAIAEPLGAARLLREVKAAGLAQHEGIVQVYDCGRLPDTRPFLVMELIELPTLEARLRQGPLPVTDALTITRNIALALQAAHDAGIVHRDIKPSNLFVDDALHIKISDFGAAKLIGDTTRITIEGSSIGTPAYMSPEQARNEPVDRRADLYALGCVLFEMVTGHAPFSGDSAVDIVQAHLFSPLPDPESALGPIPLAVKRTIRRAMAKNPRERHQTARELIGDLDVAMQSAQRNGWRKWLQ